MNATTVIGYTYEAATHCIDTIILEKKEPKKTYRKGMLVKLLSYGDMIGIVDDNIDSNKNSICAYRKYQVFVSKRENVLIVGELRLGKEYSILSRKRFRRVEVFNTDEKLLYSLDVVVREENSYSTETRAHEIRKKALDMLIDRKLVP